MAREKQPPRTNAQSKTSLRAAGPMTMSIPLNDDREEKSLRFHSRQALQEKHLNSIKAAASPVRKRKSGAEGGPQTPDGHNKENEGVGPLAMGSLTPAKRVPILANFEEWMKMATDNKINATNSWNFALIDYFHDMSLLKDGDSVNFQKASCTLDGCVKIYTSRVDSVATETGKLLSGLADSGNKKQKDDEAEGADAEDDDEDGEGKKKTRKRVQRSSEATLVSSFAQLQLKKMELEFSVDPLFKKASADFDEGGAKGLLLNHLTIDANGRIVFDSSDDAQEEAPTRDQQEDQPSETQDTQPDSSSPEPEPISETLIDIASLGQKFFPDLSVLDDQDICPSLKLFELGGSSDALDLPFIKAPEDWRKDSTKAQDSIDFGDDDEVSYDAAPDVGFGEGGEAWARDASIEVQTQQYSTGDTEDAVDGEEQLDNDDESRFAVKLRGDREFEQDNILSYFDNALQKNWAGPEHWRIRKIKDSTKPAVPVAKRKEKEPFVIDFASPITGIVADLIDAQAASNATISLPKTQWKSKTRNLLPDDKHFNSRQLLSLFLKPKARIGPSGVRRRKVAKREDLPEGELDEAFWARQSQEAAVIEPDDALPGTYDANFFQDDHVGGGDDDDEVFADAQEEIGSIEGSQAAFAHGSIESLITEENKDGFGSQLVTQSRRIRPEYVQYARVAKKVDVRRLKEEMWRGIGFESLPPQTTDTEPTAVPSTNGETLKFTEVMSSLQSVYPEQAMADISTSYCFICLLHLANEKGLVLKHEQGFEEINITKDPTAENLEAE